MIGSNLDDRIKATGSAGGLLAGGDRVTSSTGGAGGFKI
jgi:hypothetical protein